MKAEIISIGDEILYGEIVDANSTFIAEKLTNEGIEVVFATSVGDDIAKIAQAFDTAESRADVIVVTGGLGPTSDDLTKKALVKAFKRNLVFHEEILKEIEKSFAKRGKSMPKINQNQALIPQGAKPLANLWGVAPGIFIEADAPSGRGNILFFALPGVPLEMKWMLENEVLPILRSKKSNGFILRKTLRTTGISESALYERIEGVLEPKEDIKIAFLPSYLGVDIRLTANLMQKSESAQMDARLGEAKIEELEQRIRDILGIYIFGTGDQTLEEVVGKLLADNGKTIAVAESCTGGLIGAKFTNVSGSSKYFERGMVTYSNQAKIELLGIPQEIIDQYGAVSERTAILMAEGVRKSAKTDYGLSSTGIAGPTGGTPEKPVGLVYIGFACENDSFAQKFQFGGERITNRERAAQAALNMVRLFLIK
jgi:nicotinamide-nucleotide amidase